MSRDTFELHDTFTFILFVSKRKQHFLVNKITTEWGGVAVKCFHYLELDLVIFALQRLWWRIQYDLTALTETGIYFTT